jgi:hypothetical protein
MHQRVEGRWPCRVWFVILPVSGFSTAERILLSRGLRRSILRKPLKVKQLYYPENMARLPCRNCFWIYRGKILRPRSVKILRRRERGGLPQKSRRRTCSRSGRKEKPQRRQEVQTSSRALRFFFVNSRFKAWTNSWGVPSLGKNLYTGDGRYKAPPEPRARMRRFEKALGVSGPSVTFHSRLGMQFGRFGSTPRSAALPRGIVCRW